MKNQSLSLRVFLVVVASILMASVSSRFSLAQSSTRVVYPPANSAPSYPSPGSGTRIVYPTAEPIQNAGSSTREMIVQPESQRIISSGAATGSSPRAMPMPMAAVPQTFEQKFWGYLTRAKYRNWAPVPGKSDDMYEGQSPHGAHLKMYLNRRAAGNPDELPSGSIVIKENYGADQKTLMAITVMYKNAGYNPKSSDWYWVKYNPDGTVATKNTDAGVKSLAGRVQGCIDCHSGADGGDYSFFND